ncbi:MAG: ATP-binding protein, partial [Clostridiales bacterium]|nr:ATP-binding protein [Clostridiales bacterium]
TCKTFAKNLSGNLLFMGSSGVGKSYTAGVVAIEAASRGVHVMYESACTLLVRFDDERFSQSPEEREGSRQQNCDLFILDDLGTENASPYAISRLYELINYRLLRNFPSIVITGLAHDELRRKYSPALLSRLLGSYTTLLFFGPDLRKSYNEMRG